MIRRMARSRVQDVGCDPDPRFTFANERTFLAWTRTALALIGGGLAAGQLLHFHSRALRLVVALVPIAAGGILALAAYRRWEASERALRLGKSLPAAPTRTLALLLTAIAVLVAIALVVDG
jgi:putative membrane protein